MLENSSIRPFITCIKFIAHCSVKLHHGALKLKHVLISKKKIKSTTHGALKSHDCA